MQWLYTQKATSFLDIKQLGHPSNNFKTSSDGVQVLSIQQRQTNAPYMVPGATFFSATATIFSSRSYMVRGGDLVFSLQLSEFTSHKGLHHMQRG